MTLEELLNNLIEKGWRPFGKEKKELKFVEIGKEMLLGWEENYYCSKGYSYRELVSKESGLWQFCVENGYNQYKKEYRMGYTKYNNKAEYWDEGDYEYYLIEASLKDESELKEFLLDNIQIGE